MNEIKNISNTLRAMADNFTIAADNFDKVADNLEILQNKIRNLEIEFLTEQEKNKAFKRKMANLLLEDTY
jgi:predicted  nucleic acid-binding Zn-ribbon protein